MSGKSVEEIEHLWRKQYDAIEALGMRPTETQIRALREQALVEIRALRDAGDAAAADYLDLIENWSC